MHGLIVLESKAQINQTYISIDSSPVHGNLSVYTENKNVGHAQYPLILLSHSFENEKYFKFVCMPYVKMSILLQRFIW